MSEQGISFLIGIIVATISYFSKNFIFSQMLLYRQTVGKIRNRLRYHAGIITNDEFQDAIAKPIREEIRQLSCDLDEYYYSTPFVSKLFWLYRMPSPANLDTVASKLIFLSNTTGKKNTVDKNLQAVEEIKRILNLEVT